MSMSLGKKDQRESVLHCDIEETDSGNTGYDIDIDIDIEGEEKSILPARMCPSCQQHLPSSCPVRTRDLRNREEK